MKTLLKLHLLLLFKNRDKKVLLVHLNNIILDSKTKSTNNLKIYMKVLYVLFSKVLKILNHNPIITNPEWQL
jgi:hypothetical protein